MTPLLPSTAVETSSKTETRSDTRQQQHASKGRGESQYILEMWPTLELHFISQTTWVAHKEGYCAQLK